MAGAIGPTPKTASISPDVNDPGARNVTFDELVEAYLEQARALAEGGVDLFLVETIFDTLNAKAALFAIEQFFDESRAALAGDGLRDGHRRLGPHALRADGGGVLELHAHVQPLTVGLNCALGAALMRPYIAELARRVPTSICVYPNAGLPNPLSETGYDEPPDITASLSGSSREPASSISRAAAAAPRRSTSRRSRRR